MNFQQKKHWLVTSEALFTITIFLVSVLIFMGVSIVIVALLFFSTSFIAATHDTAIDGYYMQTLSKEEQAKFVGYRVMAYRML